MAGVHAADARDARKHLRRKALEFDEADADGDQEIGYDEFCEYILPKVRGARHTDADLKEWWALMDIDGDGFIRKDEYFLYTLCAASRKAGSGINAIFAEFDKDGSGNLDEIEFEQALETMGFGDAATAVFEEYQNATTRTVSYLTLLKKVEERTILPAMRSFLMALASDSMIKVDTSKWSFGGATPQEARSGLVMLLKKHSVRLSNLFQQLDDDGSFSLTLAELKDAFWELGYTGKPEVVGEIFSSLDQDGSGKAGFDEFNAWVHGRKLERNRPEDRAARLSLVPQLQVSFDAGDDAWTPGRLQVELNAALGAEGLRGVDLLKAWDCGKLDDKLDDGPSVKSMTAHLPDRQLSQKEYLIAFKRLCGGGELWYAMARDAAHEAFKMIDKSGDKAIGVAELCRWVDPHGRLVAAGRSKSRKAMAQPTGSVVAEKPEARVEEGEEEQHAQSSVCCYSPTKLSTRIAQIRAFDPDLLKPPPKAASRTPAVPTTAGRLLSTARLPEGFASVTATEGVADGAAVCLDTPSRGLRLAIAQAAHSGWSTDRLQASFTEISRLEGFDLPPSALSCPILGVGRAGAPTPRSARLMRPATAPFRTSIARVPFGSAQHVVTPRGSKGAQAASPRALPALRVGVVVFTPR